MVNHFFASHKSRCKERLKISFPKESFFAPQLCYDAKIQETFFDKNLFEIKKRDQKL